mmetsp:Transcript_59923/g.67062  ORF Transcript_59923/g.67062 Transcript_59923/m.67062 type:complete len:86 (-) Transcript_59923:10-267(-)
MNICVYGLPNNNRVAFMYRITSHQVTSCHTITEILRKNDDGDDGDDDDDHNDGTFCGTRIDIKKARDYIVDGYIYTFEFIFESVV